MVLPDSNNIFENMGVNGNSAICKPSGDVKLQSSSMAEKKNSIFTFWLLKNVCLTLKYLFLKMLQMEHKHI
jgi:hypothetical protein